MNIENIDKTIAIMERAKERDSIYMAWWQSDSEGAYFDEVVVKTQEEFHACGNKACLAGHIAISPEWKSDGGKVGSTGYSFKGNRDFSDAIAEWWDVPIYIANAFIYSTLDFYPVSFTEVKAEHVIDKLQELKVLSEEDFADKYNITLGGL